VQPIQTADITVVVAIKIITNQFSRVLPAVMTTPVWRDSLQSDCHLRQCTPD